MSNVRNIRETKSTNGQASEWLVLLESGEATVEEQAKFEAWLEHPGHRAAFNEIKGTWARLQAMGDHARNAGLAEPDPEAMVRHLARSATKARRDRRIAWSAAASLAVAAVAGTLLYPYDSGIVYRTDVGQQTTVTLPDRSTLQLNTDTEVRVAYTDDVRNVEMLRGEAYFDVAKDADRPFVVEAGHGVIRAVGTGFVVQMKPNEIVAVTVTEGVVAVTRDTESSENTSVRRAEGNDRKVPTVRKGQRVEFDRQIGKPAAVPQEQLDRDLAWRQGMLIFDGQTLDEVIREVDRYTDVHLIIVDGALRNLRIGGAFRAGDVEALLEVLEKGFNVDVKRDGPRNVYLRAARTATSG